MTETLPPLLPAGACQAKTMTLSGAGAWSAAEERGHWYSPAAVQERIDAAVAAEREKWRSTELDVLAVYSGAGQRRQWANAGAWLYPGDVLAVVSERATHIMQRGTLGDGTPVMGTVYEVLDDYKQAADVEARLGDEARAECNELRADADRYRWIKSRRGLTLKTDGTQWTRVDGSTFISTHFLAEGGTQHAPAHSLDAVIDAARATAPAEKG